MRALRVLLVIFVILGALFVIGDRVAVNYAEGLAADKIRSSQGLEKNPEVSIKGFPFLTQVAGSSLDEVDVDLNGIEANATGHTLRVDRLSAQFHDVTLDSGFRPGSAASATGKARISYADLTKAAGGGVKISYGGQKNGRSQVKISPNISVPLVSDLQVTGSISVSGNTVTVRADEIPAMCRAIPACQSSVRSQTDHVWKLDQLPGNLKLDKVVTTAEGVSLTASGTDVKLPS